MKNKKGLGKEKKELHNETAAYADPHDYHTNMVINRG